MGRKRIIEEDSTNVEKVRMKVKAIYINGFPHYYCLAEDRYVNLYHDKCLHLREIGFESVILEFEPDEVNRRFD
ncbi:MAG: hypothetical protein QXF82_10585 [Nitrososphaeria archaeon]